MEEDSPPPAFDVPSGFALRVKYQKHIFCIPVDPKTTYDELAKISIKLLEKTNLEIPNYLEKENWKDLTVDDLAFFEISNLIGKEETIKFIEISKQKKTISLMKLKDGADAIIAIGFKNKKTQNFQLPEIIIPNLIEDDLNISQSTTNNNNNFSSSKGKLKA